MENNVLNLLVDIERFIEEPFVFPGGYKQVLLMSDGALLCHSCTKAEWQYVRDATLDQDDSGWCANAVTVYWEGPAEHCAHCGSDIEAEYGNPYEDEE